MSGTEAPHPGGITIDDLPHDLGTNRQVPRGEAVWTRGKPFECVFFLRSGRICITVENEKGRGIVLRTVRRGEPFGLTCLSPLRRQRASSSAKAIVDSEVLEIEVGCFLSYISSRRDLLAELASTLGERLAYAEDRACILANHDAEDRVCVLLEQLARRVGCLSIAEPAYYVIHFTHAELAEQAGLTRAHLTVVMNRLRRIGIVHYSRSSPLLVNVALIAGRRALSVPNELTLSTL